MARRAARAAARPAPRPHLSASAPARLCARAWVLKRPRMGPQTARAAPWQTATTNADGVVPDFPGELSDGKPLVVPPGAAMFALV